MLCDELKQKLKAAGISQESLCIETGRDRAVISRQLSGEVWLVDDVRDAARRLIAEEMRKRQDAVIAEIRDPNLAAEVTRDLGLDR